MAKTTIKGRDLTEDFLTEFALEYVKFEDGKADFFMSPPLYKKVGEYVEETYYKFDKPASLLRYVDTAKGKRAYPSKIKATTTKTAEERAFTVIRNKLRKNVRAGWCETVEEAHELTPEDLMKPQLLHKYHKYKRKVVFPCIMQPKLDGVRAIWDADKQRILSRSGKEYDLPHLVDALKAFNTLDGEICYEDVRLLPDVIHGISIKDPELRFFAFDLLADTEAEYKDRLAALIELKKGGYLDAIVQLSKSVIANNHTEIEDYWASVTSRGMEGIVIKNLADKYKYDSRSYGVLKYKIEFEGEYKVEDVVPDDSPEGQMASFICVTDKGKEFKVVPAWSHPDRIAFFWYVSKHVDDIEWEALQILVEYRSMSKDDIPIHAVGKTSYKQMLKRLGK